jgi:hypothetical protein
MLYSTWSRSPLGPSRLMRFNSIHAMESFLEDNISCMFKS